MTCSRLLQPRVRWLVAATAALLLLLAWAATASAGQPDNQLCLGCHTNPGLSTTLANGDVLPLTVDPQVYNSSVHGQKAQLCVSCHTNISGYPHPKVTAGDRRSFQLERYTQCQTCHQDQYKQTLDSNHARALAAGNRNAAICTDCHGAHDVQKPGTPKQAISATCQKCHSTIYEQYAGSVHGSALTKTGNGDVPVCTDCHGVHQQADPTTAAFRLKSPSICANCHGNASLMQKYGISTDVMNTYVADFHGTTVTLFEKQSPDQATNKAVCTDCHGIHDIKQVSSTDATVVKQNLLTTCQKCHPDATTNFPDAWVGHWRPSPTSNPLVYYVNLFYKILIPSVIGAMGLFVVVDGGRRIWDRSRRKKGA
jgi:predicted CXXCH cytochrome family protein